MFVSSQGQHLEHYIRTDLYELETIYQSEPKLWWQWENLTSYNVTGWGKHFQHYMNDHCELDAINPLESKLRRQWWTSPESVSIYYITGWGKTFEVLHYGLSLWAWYRLYIRIQIVIVNGKIHLELCLSVSFLAEEESFNSAFWSIFVNLISPIH